MSRPRSKNAAKLTLTVDEDIRDAARRLAEDERTSISSLLEAMVLERYERVYKTKVRVRPPKKKKGTR